MAGAGVGHGGKRTSTGGPADPWLDDFVTNALKMVLAGMAIVIALLAATVIWVVARTAETAEDVATEILGEGEVTRVGEVTVTSIRSLAQLTTVELVEYTRVEKSDDRGWLNWATGDSISMFVVARIGAGVDLSQVTSDDIDADPETGVATIRLPAAEITYVDVDEEQTTVYDRDTGLFTKGDPNLEQSARLAAEEVLVDAALEKGITDRASEEAADVITVFVESLGYTDVRIISRG